MSRLERLKKLVEADPQDPLAHYGVGLEYINREQWTDAAGAFTKTIECDAAYAAAYYHKGRAQIEAGRNEDARRTLTAGIEVARSTGDLKTEAEMRDLLEALA